MSWLPVISAAAKLWSGFIGYRGAKRQAKNLLTEANIQHNYVKSNILGNTLRGYGSALLASHHGGGFSANAFSSGFNDLAADLRTAQFNAIQQQSQAWSQLSAARMSLLSNAVDAALGYWSSTKAQKKVVPKNSSPLSLLNDPWGGN